jgi:Xaa-Pro aminopeptidase
MILFFNVIAHGMNSVFSADAHERRRVRREQLLSAVGDGVMIFCSAPEQLKSRDTEIRFRQDSDLYYLTGFPEPEAVAVLTPYDAEHRFTLFVRPRDPEREVWAGRRFGVDGARAVFGADAAYPIDELSERLPKLLEPAQRIVYALGSSTAMDAFVLGQVTKFRRTRQRSGQGPIVVADPDLWVAEMRLVKDAGEIELLRQAARISARGHRAAMAAAGPGVGEWEVEAVLEAAFRAAGARGAAYPSIVGAGANATTLHYVSNDQVARDGDLMLIDAGAEWEMYCGDITRTFPVSGRFTDVQRAVYDVVLAAENAAIETVRPGARIGDVHVAATRVLTQGLVELGLLAGDVDELVERGAQRRFYMHQTSHWLGLDVHDVGLYTRDGESVVLRPGMVLTVEPGIYIPADAEDVPAAFRGIGVRIEDDVLVTAQGHEILTRDVPVDPAEVEQLVGRGRERSSAGRE